ncbi:formyltransferase family protein [Natronorubrum texcoconense]|uniref:Formyl transferase n=1 Tax=Natronorubrum texcoconense TaxID=1095776 RepID=A0A1G8YDE0_9EURY|nr:formyltransferase family protein [Natronorubrum texcoconense]SDK00444.1 Formyl transferase [Natronorubrum texcoconense]
MSSSVTVGILAEPFLYQWQARAIERLEQRSDVTVSLVVSNAANTNAEAESWNRKARIELDDVVQFADVIQRERAWTFVLAERTLGRVLGDEHHLWHRHSLENVDCLADAEFVPCEPRTEDGWTEFPDDIVSRLAADCDVAIRFGFGLVRGDVLTAPEYGVLSFHPADIRRYRGMGPPVLYRDGRDRAGATLQQLDESIDGGAIVAYDEVSLDGCYTLWDVFDRLAELQIRLLTEGVSNACDPEFDPETVPDDQLGEFYSRDQRRTLGFSGRVLTKNSIGRFRRRLEHVRSSTETVDRPTQSSN